MRPDVALMDVRPYDQHPGINKAPAVREIIGNPDIRLYAGGLAEWTRDDANPLERRVSVDEWRIRGGPGGVDR